MNKRLFKEIKELEEEITNNQNLLKLDYKENDLRNLTIIFKGPENTPYFDGNFSINVIYPIEYPFKPPKIKFVNKILHPNIDNYGSVCIDILADKWSPALTITKVIISLCSLMASPNPDSPLNSEIADIYKKNRDLYNIKVSEYTKKYSVNL
jgi:ubiquitin-conjugating enzyme E2 D/E